MLVAVIRHLLHVSICFRVRPTRLPWVALTEQFIWLRVGHKSALSLRLRLRVKMGICSVCNAMAIGRAKGVYKGMILVLGW